MPAAATIGWCPQTHRPCGSLFPSAPGLLVYIAMQSFVMCPLHFGDAALPVGLSLETAPTAEP